MQLTLPILIGLALADSINPVSFGVLVNLLKQYKDSPDLNQVGYQYIASFFCTYTVIGILLSVLLIVLSDLSAVIYSVIGAFIILLGLLELNRLFDIRIPIKRLTLEPKKRIETYKDFLNNQPAVSLALGIHTATRELTFTGGFYLGLISLLNINNTGSNRYTFIFFYNMIVVLPLLILLHSIKTRASITDFQVWDPQVRRPMMIGIACLQVVLGIWLLLWWFV